MNHGLEASITGLLQATNMLSGFPWSLVCTEAGLLVASAGDEDLSEVAAGLTSLFNDILGRAERDLEFSAVDEFTILDPKTGRFVVRPLVSDSSGNRLFLVVLVPRAATWRRATNDLTKRLIPLLQPLLDTDSIEPADE
ncbi:MAG: hypothetical protein AB8H79_22480 [Myxococcota bacterium]